MPMPSPVCVRSCLLLALVVSALPAAAQTARERYERAFEREAVVRPLLADGTDPTPAERTDVLRQVTRLVAAYEAIVRRYPTTGYADNALWQGASLSEAAYRRFGRADERPRSPRPSSRPREAGRASRLAGERGLGRRPVPGALRVPVLREG